MTALYNKYRPGKLAELIGQEHVTKPLSSALDRGEVRHAYLLTGPRGCGKTSTSRILAKSINCVNGPTSNPCQQCASCKSITDGTSLDVDELDAASKGGVDDARELRNKALTQPAVSRYRVIIIDEAHMVTTAGFNALLKIVEEAPKHLVFIFATTEPEKVLTTIKSRTFQYPFRLVDAHTMNKHLHHIADLENAKIEEGAYPLIIKNGGGSVRDTLGTLDQLLTGRENDTLTVTEAQTLLGATDSELLEGTVDAIIENNGEQLFLTVDKVMNVGLDPRRFGSDVLERLRDLTILKTMNEPNWSILNAVTERDQQVMLKQAQKAALTTLIRASELFNQSLNEMRLSTSPRLSLELGIAKLVGENTQNGDINRKLEAIWKKLDQVSQGQSVKTVERAPVEETEPVSKPVPAPKPVPTHEEPIPEHEDEPPTEEPIKDVNPQPQGDAAKVLDKLREKRQAASILLGQHGEMKKTEPGVMSVKFRSEGLKKAFRPYIPLLEEALSETFPGKWKVNLI